MSKESRLLNVGDWCLTDYNHASGDRQAKTLDRVQIVAVDRERRNGHSQSGIMFQVRPLLKGGTLESWYCADWFQVEKQPEAQKPPVNDSLPIHGPTTERSDAYTPGGGPFSGATDPLYEQAIALVRKHNKASISLVQRHLQIGYNRTAYMMDAMEKQGVVTPYVNGVRMVIKDQGAKP